MNETWTPAIFDNDGSTLHERLVQAVRAGIASGELEPEERMPTHRELASRLGIGVGTVTRAYAEASAWACSPARSGAAPSWRRQRARSSPPRPPARRRPTPRWTSP